MPSINDFVDNRWTDAKEELRRRDPDYVRRVEETVRLQHVGLEALDFEPGPRARLPKEWHALLEDCDELVRKASILQTAIDCFIADSGGELSSGNVGKRIFYHIQSWFIQAQALAEYTQRVIGKTTKLYISAQGEYQRIAKCRKNSVSCQVSKMVESTRNRFVHATGRSSSTNLTEDNLWEGSVAAGLTPHKSHDEFLFPAIAARVKAGKYHRPLTELNRMTFDRLGAILRELEEDIARHNAQTNCGAMDQDG